MKKVFACYLLFGIGLCAQEVTPASAVDENDKILPKNLALWNTNARLMEVQGERVAEGLSSAGIGADGEVALLNGDAGKKVTFTEGAHDMVIDLGSSYRLQKCSFAWLEGEAVLSVRVANQLRNLKSKRWIDAGANISLQDKQPKAVALGGMVGRYVHLRFASSGQMSFSSLGIFGDLSAQEWTVDVEESTNRSSVSNQFAQRKIPIDYASVSSSARVLYVTGAEPDSFDYAIDDDADTFIGLQDTGAMSFSAMVLDFSKKRELQKLSLLVDSSAGELQVFPIDELTELTSYRETSLVTMRRVERVYATGDDGALAPDLSSQEAIFAFMQGRTPAITIKVGSGLQSLDQLANLASRFVLIAYFPENPVESQFRLFELSLLSEVEEENLRITQLVPVSQVSEGTNNLFLNTQPVAPEGQLNNLPFAVLEFSAPETTPLETIPPETTPPEGGGTDPLTPIEPTPTTPPVTP